MGDYDRIDYDRIVGDYDRIDYDRIVGDYDRIYLRTRYTSECFPLAMENSGLVVYLHRM